MPAALFIGLMSGTSLDGVDGVLARIDAEGRLQVKAHAFEPFHAAFRDSLLQLNQSGPDELHWSALAGNEIARHYARVVTALMLETGLQASQIAAIGAHGQTVRHRPLEFDGDDARQQAAVGYTCQLLNPALLAELTQMDVVADFRNRDLAAGGQGAPLVPAFHQGVFAQAGVSVAVLNIGGIANLSVLGANGSVAGWDCGPGNALMDYWSLTHTGAAYDSGGAWAASGLAHTRLLNALASDPFLHQRPPKSTGRDLFNPAWLMRHLNALEPIAPADVQATLCAYTALVCGQDIVRYAPDVNTVIVCGGGAYNEHLLHSLAAQLLGRQVLTSDKMGLPPLQVEAAAFAWLAFKTLRRETSSLPSVTGAKGARVLGAIYPR